MTTKYQWENKKMAAQAKLFRERAEYQAQSLELARKDDLTTIELETLKELALFIAECDVEIEEIDNETYEQAAADERSSLADELRKESRS